jgi:hypothetical protein
VCIIDVSSSSFSFRQCAAISFYNTILSRNNIFAAQERRSTFDTNNQYDNLEDKLRTTEVELQLALDRASQAEAQTLTLTNKGKRSSLFLLYGIVLNTFTPSPPPVQIFPADTTQSQMHVIHLSLFVQ